MKKRTLFILFIVLALVFASLMTTVAFAADGTDAPDEFTHNDLINLIIIYSLFGVSIVIGLPAIRAVNKRKRQGYIETITREMGAIEEKIKELYADCGSNSSKRDNLRFSLKIASAADMALTTYTEKQISGYLDLYNDLNDIKTRLSSVENIKNNDKRVAEYEAIVQKADEMRLKSESLAENEKIIKRYNK